MSGEELQTLVPAHIHGCLATRAGEGTAIRARFRYGSSASLELVMNYQSMTGLAPGQHSP
ncbi:hypothetical protein [Streptomyces sp. NPDC059631]|uniref:hypothetical protein n=1 Tax=unclassified Streptomyces TaxID=2593676 RepID=UPI0036BF2D2B